MSVTLSQQLRAAEDILRVANVANPRLDAQWLFCHALRLDRTQLFSQSDRHLSVEEISRIDAAISRRQKREPVARIIGTREFWGLPFVLNEATLEPRPDSETIIEIASKELKVKKNSRLSLLDLGAGTGCLLLSLLHEFPHAIGLGIDIAPAAIEQAKQNASALGLSDRAQFRVSDWLMDVREKFDLIVSNPPYIPTPELPHLMREVRDFDPQTALDGGVDGLDPYRFLVPRLKDYLNPKGIIIVEVGIDQAAAVCDFFHVHHYSDITTYKDLGGITRCVLARRSG